MAHLARVVLGLAVLLLPAACGADSGTGGTTATRRVAVIPKGTTHVFWKSVERGARAAGDAAGVEVLWKGPLSEADRAGQIRLVQDFVSQGVAGIALAPLDHKALKGPVAAARAAGIPVVIFDSALEGTAGEDFASLIATDNRAGGRMAGEHAAELLGGKGKVVMLRYQVGSASTTAREAGFKEAAVAAGLELLSDNQYAGATAGEAKTQALNMLDTLRQADLVFCPNESSTLGMLLALQQEKLLGNGKLRLVGFDASKPLVEGLRSGAIAALVVQDPVTMGHKAVEFVVRCMDGAEVSPQVNTDAVLATRANMDESQIRALLQ